MTEKKAASPIKVLRTMSKKSIEVLKELAKKKSALAGSLYSFFFLYSFQISFIIVAAAVTSVYTCHVPSFHFIFAFC